VNYTIFDFLDTKKGAFKKNSFNGSESRTPCLPTGREPHYFRVLIFWNYWAQKKELLKKNSFNG